MEGGWDYFVSTCRSGVRRPMLTVVHRCFLDRVIAVPSQTVYMVTYDTLRKTLPIPKALDPTSSLTPLVSGILARTLVSSLSSPVELLRTRLQSTPSDPSVPHTLRSTMSGIRTMVGKEGLRSLYKGLGPTLWRDVPFSGLYWAGFEGLKRKLKRRGYDGTPVTFFSGAVSGTVSASPTIHSQYDD